MQVSDSSSRILAGLLEARTGQQLTMSRRWRIETALSALLRERAIPTLDELITILVMGRDPGLATQVVEALLNNETYFFRDRTPFDLLIKAALHQLGESRLGEQVERSSVPEEICFVVEQRLDHLGGQARLASHDEDRDEFVQRRDAAFAK